MIHYSYQLNNANISIGDTVVFNYGYGKKPEKVVWVGNGEYITFSGKSYNRYYKSDCIESQIGGTLESFLNYLQGVSSMMKTPMPTEKP